MSMGSLADGWDRFPMSQPIHRVWWRLLWAALRWQLRHLGHLGHLRQTLFEYRYPGVCGIRGCLGSWDRGARRATRTLARAAIKAPTPLHTTPAPTGADTKGGRSNALFGGEKTRGQGASRGGFASYR